MKEVVWTTRALSDLNTVMKFNTSLYGFAKSAIITSELIDRTELLEVENFRKIGSIDEAFAEFKYEYRKIFQNHCKITYREGKTKIYITRIFDTRRNPDKNI